jgi:MOSC domain-containing protein YiiM
VQGTVLALALRPEKGEAMALAESITVTPTDGVIGDHGTSKRRQVSLLDVTAWKTACSEIGVELDWTTRRSNILVSNPNLKELVGIQIRIGSALVEIIGEVIPCHVMDSAQDGLKRALKPEWRGGVYGRIIATGQVNVGDKITIHSSQ